MSGKGGDVKFTEYHKHLKAPFVIYADPDESCSNKYQEYVACTFGYKIVCVDDRFSKPEGWFWDKGAIFKFSSESFEKVNHHKEAMKKKAFKRNSSWIRKMKDIFTYMIIYILKMQFVDSTLENLVKKFSRI